MGSFWAAIAKYAVKLALYAADHPDTVISLVNTLKQPKGAPK
jgi:hypothetical protein